MTDGEIKLCCKEKKIMLNGIIKNGEKKGIWVMKLHDKKYLLNFNENKKLENAIQKKQRTFKGVRVLLVGSKNVGKTALVTRLMGSSSNSENRVSYRKCLTEKKEEEITHGFNIYNFEQNETKISFWDFAGHEGKTNTEKNK